MSADAKFGKSSNSLREITITKNYLSREEEENKIFEKEIVNYSLQTNCKKSNIELNSKLSLNYQSKNFKEELKKSDKDVKSKKSKNSSRNSASSLKETLMKMSSKKISNLGTNLEELKNFHEFTKQCMNYIDKIEFDNNQELEGLKFDLDEKYLNQIKSREKGLAIFDLDETLIHRELENYEDCDKIIEVNLPDLETNKIGIYIRPMVFEILKRISEKYVLILFTASQQEYADKVIELIDPNDELFIKRLYRDSCRQIIIEDSVFYVKDLEIFRSVPIEKMVIIDNCLISFCKQLDNGIPILPFYNNKLDTELKDLAGYLEYLYQSEDYRVENKNIFALKQNYLDDYDDSDSELNSSYSSSGDEQITIDFDHPIRDESQHKFLFSNKSNKKYNYECSIVSKANTFCSIYTSTNDISDFSKISDFDNELKNKKINTKRSQVLLKYLDVFQSKSKI